MGNRPNLFDYATSELSQDAFLTWLIQWADQDYKNLDYALNTCAASFVRELLGKDSSFVVKTVEPRRQWNNIDVCALVNNEFFIVLEDKKGTQEHSDQLNRYSEIAKQHYQNTDIEVKLVYFKMELQADYSAIKKAGYSVFERSTMLAILNNYINSTQEGDQNDIIVDYFKNLENLDNKINSYLTSPIGEWKEKYPWQGFYAELQQQIGGSWEYVANPSGGFWGFYWNHKHSNVNGKEFLFYLQLEQDKLTFKLMVEKVDERRDTKGFYRGHLFAKAQELNIDITQYGRVGKWMSVAKLNSEYRQVDENGLLDVPRTIEYLKVLTSLINETDKVIQASKE